jgi:hypothetical protein
MPNVMLFYDCEPSFLSGFALSIDDDMSVSKVHFD